MSNETDIITRSKITHKSVVNEVNNINRDIFNGMLPIEVDDEHNFIGIRFSEYDCIAIRTHRGNINFGGGHGPAVLWWLQRLMEYELANRFNSTIKDDYWIDKPRPEKYTYGTLRAYIMKPFPEEVGTLKKMFGLREYIKFQIPYNRRIIGEELFDYIWNNKI